MRPTQMLSSSRCGSNVDGQGGAAAAVRASARDGAAAPILRSAARGESVPYKATAAAAAANTTTTGWCKTIATKFSTAVIADVVIGVASLKHLLKRLDHADKTDGPVSVIECMIGQYK